MVRIYTLTLAPSLDSATITPQIYPEGKLHVDQYTGEVLTDVRWQHYGNVARHNHQTQIGLVGNAQNQRRIVGREQAAHGTTYCDAAGDDYLD